MKTKHLASLCVQAAKACVLSLHTTRLRSSRDAVGNGEHGGTCSRQAFTNGAADLGVHCCVHSVPDSHRLLAAKLLHHQHLACTVLAGIQMAKVSVKKGS